MTEAAVVGSAFCRTMARYNAWPNRGLIDALGALPPAEATRDRGAFFGSILGTLNHLLWGDTVWWSRLGRLPAPAGGISDSPRLCTDVADWAERRAQVDASILDWAGALGPGDLDGDLSWYSGAAGCEVTRPRGLCIVHAFNQQTHHRGQVHAMLTAAGLRPGDTDLFLMPDAAS
ncbi:MAG: DinB family protein [Paracoccaceae bacterium]